MHSCCCHLYVERRDLRAAAQRSTCLQSNSTCCQNRSSPLLGRDFRGKVPLKYNAKIDELERVADAAIFMKDGILANQCMVEELRINQHKSVVDLYREIYGHGGEEVC